MTKCIIFTKQEPFDSSLQSVTLWGKPMDIACVRVVGSDTLLTVVIGLQSQFLQSCNPVKLSNPFSCHITHTRMFSL